MCTLCTLRYAYTDCILALFHFLLPSFASFSSSKPRTLCQPMHTDTPPFPLARNRYRASKYWTGISVTGCYEKEREREISVPASFSLFREDYRYVYSILSRVLSRYFRGRCFLFRVGRSMFLIHLDETCVFKFFYPLLFPSMREENLLSNFLSLFYLEII